MNENKIRELIRQSCDGNRNAFDTLINYYYDTMYNIAYQWSGSQANAEDITHNAFLKMADKLSDFKFKSSFETWLYKLIINTARDYMRKANKEQNRQVDIDKQNLVSNNNVTNDLETQEFLEIINKLPDGEKEAIILVYAQGFTHGEAAKIAGCKEGTISWRLTEARKKLATKLL